MLRQLSIRHFVIVSELDLLFSDGLTVLTGETGAGKSIILDALGLVLGNRSDVGLIQKGCPRAELSAQFELSVNHPAWIWSMEQDFELESDGVLILRRVLDASGRSRQFINGSSVTVSQLKKIGRMLLDVHGQHAHQSLLFRDHQRNLVDMFAQAEPLVRQVQVAWWDWQQARRAHEEARICHQEHEFERDRLAWQHEILANLAVTDQEWDELSLEQQRLAKTEESAQRLEMMLDHLRGEQSLSSQLYSMVQNLGELERLWPTLGGTRHLLHSAWVELKEAEDDLSRICADMDFDVDRLQYVDRRLSDLMTAARQCRVSPEQLHAHHRDIQTQMDALVHEDQLAYLSIEENRAYEQFLSLAEQLSAIRRESVIQVSRMITEAMQHLALEGARFAIELLPLDKPQVHGFEQVEFLVSMNVGGNLKPLSKVASGGELSRIGLAIQMILSHQTCVSTLIFDEVDAGIGGQVAHQVGAALAKLGRCHQVICVTHLPQVASMATCHWYVEKYTKSGCIQSSIRALNGQQRVEEIARMLGSDEATRHTALYHAQAMLSDSVKCDRETADHREQSTLV